MLWGCQRLVGRSVLRLSTQHFSSDDFQTKYQIILIWQQVKDYLHISHSTQDNNLLLLKIMIDFYLLFSHKVVWKAEVYCNTFILYSHKPDNAAFHYTSEFGSRGYRSIIFLELGIWNWNAPPSWNFWLGRSEEIHHTDFFELRLLRYYGTPHEFNNFFDSQIPFECWSETYLEVRNR